MRTVPKSWSVSAPSLSVGLLLGTLELEGVVVEAEPLVLDDTLLVVEESLEVVVVVVVVDAIGEVVDVAGFLLVVGGGGVLVDFGVVEVGSDSPNTHSPYRVPTLVGAKKVNNPSEKSRPPNGHPGHSSMIVA